MAIAPEKHSSRWLNFCPCSYPGPPGPGPGPGKKHRRSLAGGLAWVLLGLVWLGSPLIIDCRDSDNNKNLNKLIDDKRTSDSNLINIYNKKKSDMDFDKINYCPNCLYNNLDNKFSISFLSSSSKQKKSTISPSRINRHRHQHQNNNKLKKNRKKLKKKPTNFNRNNKKNKKPSLTSDVIRLESIKHQILSKLGLKHKPNVTQLLPKQVIIDTIMRAGEKNFHDKLQQSDYKSDSFQNDIEIDTEPEPDDFYGRTREIISFAERGKFSKKLKKKKSNPTFQCG